MGKENEGLPDGRIAPYTREEEEEYRDRDGKLQKQTVKKNYFGSQADAKRREDFGVYRFSDKVAGYAMIALIIFLIAYILGFL